MHGRYVYMNGRIVPADQATVSPFDIGLLRGYAVFDLLRTVHGGPFLLDAHLRRLRASADHLGLTVPASDDEIRSAIARLLEMNAHREATVRLVLTGGESPDGLSFDAARPTFLIMTHDLVDPPSAVYESGGKLITEEHRREVPGAKTTNYLTMLKHRERADEEGALDLLYHEGERVFEAASASFYVVRDNTILAPQEDVLYGTVGAFVLDLASSTYPVHLGDVTLADALTADEAFLTSTTRGIVPIVQIDDRPIGHGAPGPVTRELMDRYREAVFGDANELVP